VEVLSTRSEGQGAYPVCITDLLVTPSGFDYIFLSIAYFFSWPKNINVHGGYFDGEFCQILINELAFLGYKGLLLKYSKPILLQRNSNQFESLLPDQQNELFNQFSLACQEKYIQVILASKKVPNATTLK